MDPQVSECIGLWLAEGDSKSKREITFTNNKNLIIISKLKSNYLLFLDKEKNTSEFAKYFKVCWKSSYNRLNELKKLKLVRRKNNGKWIRLKTKKKLLVI